MSKRSLSYYQRLFETVQVLPNWEARLSDAVAKCAPLIPFYRGVVYGSAAPWQVLACVHLLEASCGLNRNLFNGQRLERRTTIQPVGLGPWPDWPAMAAQWVKQIFPQAVSGQAIDSPASALMWLERYNGLGYAMRGVNSPYLWSGSNHGIATGKFTADGKYDPNVVSRQVGAALVLRTFSKIGL